MYNPIFTDPNNALLTAKLKNLATYLKTLSFPTKEEYQAAVIGGVNQILALGSSMTPLYQPIPEGPAVIGDFTTNMSSISSDLSLIVNEISRIESITASFFNQMATTQTNIRQSIRSLVYASSISSFIEDYINTTQMASSPTANIDINAGVATATLSNSTELTYTVSLGVNTLGTTTGDVTTLLNGDLTQTFTLNGSILELIFSNPTASPLNRIRLYLDNYNDLEIIYLVSTPDGIVSQDILASMNLDPLLVNCLSGKYSGDVILDFPAVMASSIKLQIADRTGANSITLRGVELWQLSYNNTGMYTSNPIYNPVGNVTLSTVNLANPPFTSITHQISYDGVQYFSVTEGGLEITSSPFWHKVLFARDDTKFVSNQSNTLDPVPSSTYTLGSSSATPIGTVLIQRVLTLTNITGPITLRDLPIPNTLSAQQGAVTLNLGTDYFYSATSNVISFPNPVSAVTINYQCSANEGTYLPSLKNYYTAYLSEVRFDKA